MNKITPVPTREVIIPESILCTIVFPKIIEAFITVGPGDCYKGLRNKGCGMCHISTRVCGMLMRCLPRCKEPFCRNPAIHRCFGGQPICCVHCARFGFMHRPHHSFLYHDINCICQCKVPNYNPVKSWVDERFNKRVQINEYQGSLYVTFWKYGFPDLKYNLTQGEKIILYAGSISTVDKAEAHALIFLLYHFVIEVDKYIFVYKNPGLAKKWKKIKI